MDVVAVGAVAVVAVGASWGQQFAVEVGGSSRSCGRLQLGQVAVVAVGQVTVVAVGAGGTSYSLGSVAAVAVGAGGRSCSWTMWQ